MRLLVDSICTEAKMPEKTNLTGSDSDANFVGWQETLSGEFLPLFNITAAAHPLYQSTVSEATLRRLHLRFPRIIAPYPEARPSPWHNTGIALDHPQTARDAIEMAGLNFTVVKKPLVLKTSAKHNSYATVRTDTNDVLGFVKDSYEPIQNSDAFRFFDSLVAKDEAVYETAGSLGKGELIWILAKLHGYINVHGDDIVNKYLLLTNSHDGSAHVRVKLTPIRAVCNNTLTAALQGAGEIQINRTEDAARNLEQAATIHELSNSLYGQLEVLFNAMFTKKITPVQLREYVQALIPDNEDDGNAIRTENIRQSVLHLHDFGRGADMARGTFWGAFNSVTEYADHIMSRGDSATRLNSIWFGRGEQLKLKAFHLAKQMMRP
jgi:phage/plasmid-like protein (TIGR03299 family)